MSDDILLNYAAASGRPHTGAGRGMSVRSEWLTLPFAPAVAVPLEDFPSGMDVLVVVVGGVAPVGGPSPSAWKEDLEDAHRVAVPHRVGVTRIRIIARFAARNVQRSGCVDAKD